MRSFIKKITHPFLKSALDWYYSKPRKYCYGTSFVTVHPDVFPPHLTISTKLLLDFIQPKEIKGKSFLELGCGSGIISVYAAKKGAMVTASDINETALEFLEKSAVANSIKITIVNSDLFEKLNGQSFDYIIINPPYYPKTPKNIKEKAWFCGKDFEYFERLFLQLPEFLSDSNQTFMILSEDCQLEKIQSIALKNNIAFELVQEKTVYAEKNYIYQLQLLN